MRTSILTVPLMKLMTFSKFQSGIASVTGTVVAVPVRAAVSFS
jgi:hypothetical protein